jgi:hypothetical protein
MAVAFRRTARTIGLLGAFSIALLTQPFIAVAAQGEPAQVRQCSNASLNGAYGLNFQGASDPLGRFVSVSLLTFDGKGGFSATETFNSQATGPQTRSITGTYAVQGNCGFTLSEQSNTTGQHGADAICVLVDNGNQFYCVDFEAGWQLLGVGTRIESAGKPAGVPPPH